MTNLLRLVYYLSTSRRRFYWTRERLRCFQEKRLRSIVSYAYRYVPYYHEKYKNAGVRPSDITTLEDLSKLPVVGKNELRAEKPRRLVSVEFDPQRLKVVRTSGSTGEPLFVYLNSNEDDWRKAIYMRANISCGQRPRDRWVAITGPLHFGDTTKLQQRLGIFARHNISVFSQIDSQIRSVKEAGPDVLDGYSGSLLLLAREYEEKSVEPPCPRIIFGTAELIDEASVKIIERVFNAPYYDQFGCVELNRTAWQCPEKVGYHMDVDSVITQFLDSDGNEVSAGETGDVLYTSLFNYAMPILRYAVGDVGKSSPEECPCGRKFPLMKVVEGRKDSFIKLPDGQWISPRTFTVAMSMFSRYQEISAFRVIQRKLDYIEFYIKPKKDNATTQTLEKELRAHLDATLKLNKLGVSISVVYVDTIPATKTGKLNAVSSEVNA